MRDILNFTDLSSELDVWQAAGYPGRIEYSRTLVEELGIAATEGFHRVRRGGVEIGGVLFGVREPHSVKILAHRALACEYAFGPSFTLSENDRQALEDLLASPEMDRDLSGMQAIGWYHSHTRSEILLSEKDLELFQQYFPETWQIALVLRPNRFDPVRAGFFFREQDGSVHAASSRHEFTIQPAGKAAMRLPEERTPAPAILPVPEPATLETSPPPLPLLPAPSKYPRRRWTWGIAAIVGVLAGALFWNGGWRAPADVSLHALDVGGQLRIDWNCNPRVVQRSASGELEIEDGSRKVLNVLSREQLRAGSLTYARTGGDVLVRLLLHNADRTTLTQTARFLGTPVATAAPIETGSAERPADKPPVPREPEADTQRKSERTRQARVASPPAPRQLVLPARSLPSPAPAIAANNAPPITTIVPRLPAPELAPLNAADAGAAIGKMIWTGMLVRHDTIEIVANHASKGHVTGSLPGGPIRVRVFPAELTHEGLRIFTADPKSVGARETAGAQNGWNRAVYVLNPRQAGDVTIVEAPSQQNAWNSLTLRAERSAHSIIVLRWERIPAPSTLHEVGDR